MMFGIYKTIFVLTGVYSVIDSVFGALSANVTVDHPAPIAGTAVSLTCYFNLGAYDTLNQVVWSFGPQLQGATRIVHWRENEPNIVHYNHGYTYTSSISPIYQMTIANLYQGKTVLTINPIVLYDRGSYWCSVVVNSTELAFATTYVQVHARASPTVNLYLQGEQEIERGFGTTFFCNYTKSPIDTISRLSWTHGIQFESSVKISDFLLYGSPTDPVASYHEPYKPPGYEAAFNEVDRGDRGYSSLSIASARIRDGGRYWCAIEISRHIQALITSVDISVLGIPTTAPPTTTPVPTTKRLTTTTKTTTTTPAKPTTSQTTTTASTTKIHTSKMRTTTTPMTTTVPTTPLATSSKMYTSQTTTNTYGKRTKAHSKIMTGVILAAVPAFVIATCLVCLGICRYIPSAKQTTPPNDDEKPAPPKLPPKGIPPKGYEDLQNSHQRRPRAYQRLISSFAMVVGHVGRSVPTDDFPEYEYPEPNRDKYELSIVGNTYHEYSPVSPY
ncbi:uncharacterized protein [Amphiura filiformis]|uniref:uncharacterized protein isoform X2 n=1 Tax=Amphiura filiformis TaxID=82378 RepID=UPI003B211DD1